MEKPIQDFNFFYWLLKPFVQFSFVCHYNSVTLRGLKNLPRKSGGYILAPNHQQALMEPLAILVATQRPTVFLARADIFEKPVQRFLLTFLKILPIYRIRDGKESLSKDAEIFDKSRSVLLANYPLCLMAEGRHNNRHQLLPLVKGMFRIAGDAQKQMGDKPLYIVPVGMDFDEYEQPYSNLIINIGKPISVQPFMKTFEENEALALNQMRDALAPAMMKQMHDIRSKTYYEEINTLCNIENKYWRRHSRKTNTAWHRFNVRRALANKYDSLEAGLSDPIIEQTTLSSDIFEKTMQKTRDYQQRCRNLHISEKLSSEHYGFWLTMLHTVILGGIVTAMCLVGWVRWIIFFCLLCYPVPFLPFHLIAKHAIADSQFRSSITYGIRLTFAFLWILAFAIVCNCTGGMWMGSHIHGISHFWWGFIGWLLSFPLAFFGGRVYTYLRNWLNGWYYWIMRTFHVQKFRDLDALRDELCK
jgi:1-acyl-sn-glycerol-3-phosphate acyltransferase